MIAVLKGKDFWTPMKRLMATASPGRGKGRLPGGHVLDRADLFKSLVLCGNCVGKFNAGRAGYVTKANLPFVRGRCDGCQQHTPRGHMLVHHSFANTL